MADHLAPLSPDKVAEFYRRLASTISAKDPNSLAADLLIHWLDGKGKKKTISPDRVKGVSFVNEYLQEEVRPVFLTEEKAKLKGGERWAGIIPRINRIPPYDKISWTGSGPVSVWYEGPSVEIPLSVQAMAAINPGSVDPNELDLLYGLHTFGLHTDVEMEVSRIGTSTRYNVTFKSWRTYVIDRYNWDPTKHITVPNPDYKNPSGVASPVAPGEKTVTVYHKHAIRAENAGLAAPFDVESQTWEVLDTKISGPATVDTARCWAKSGGVYCKAP